MKDKVSLDTISKWIENEDLEKIMEAAAIENIEPTEYIRQKTAEIAKKLENAERVAEDRVKKTREKLSDALDREKKTREELSDALVLQQELQNHLTLFKNQISDLSNTNYLCRVWKSVNNNCSEDFALLTQDLSLDLRFEILKWAPSSDNGWSVAFLILRNKWYDDFARITRDLSKEQRFIILTAVSANANDMALGSSLAFALVSHQRFDDFTRLTQDFSKDDCFEILQAAPTHSNSVIQGTSVAWLLLHLKCYDNFIRLTRGLSEDQCYQILIAALTHPDTINQGTSVAWMLLGHNLFDDFIRLTQGLSKERRYEILKAAPSNANNIELGVSVGYYLLIHKRDDDFYRLTQDLSADQRFEILRTAPAHADRIELGISVGYHLLIHKRDDDFYRLTQDLSADQRFEILGAAPAHPGRNDRGRNVAAQLLVHKRDDYFTQLMAGLSPTQCFEILSQAPTNPKFMDQGKNVAWLLLIHMRVIDFTHFTQGLSAAQCFEILKASPTHPDFEGQGQSVAWLLLLEKCHNDFNRLTQDLSPEQCFEILKASPTHPNSKSLGISVAWLLLLSKDYKECYLDFIRLTKNLSENQSGQLLTAPAALKSRIYSPLHLAVYFGKTTAAAILLDNNVDINQKVAMSTTKLTLAKTKSTIASKVDHDDYYKALAAFTDSVNEGDAALHIALKRGQATMVALLLARGADPNLCDLNSVSPLALAVDHIPDAIVGLLNKGAIITDLTKKAIAKVIDYLYQSRERHVLLSECIKAKPSIATVLLADGNSLLLRVIQKAQSSNPDRELLQLIVMHCDKMNLNKCNTKKQKAINLAIEMGIEDDIIFTLAQYSTLTMQPNDSHAVLELCFNARRSNQLVQFLLEKGAYANEHSCRSPHLLMRSVIEQSQNTELLILLLEHGASLKTVNEMESLLKTAQEHQVDERVLKLIQSKISDQKPAVVEIRPQPKSGSSENNAQVVRLRDAQIQRDWGRVACWNASGNGWKKGGAPDDSFYQQIQLCFTSKREEGLTREQIIAAHLKDYVRLKNTPAAKGNKIKAPPKAEKTETAKPANESKPQKQSRSIALPTKKSPQIFAAPDPKTLIDWSVEGVNAKKKKSISKPITAQ